MAEVKRYGGRTYGKIKAQPQDSAASKAFDEAFAKPKPTRWGNVSYVKPRNDNDDLDKKKSDIAEEEKDPFSFEFDNEKSPKKRQQTKLQSKVMQPAVRIASTTVGKGKTSGKSALDDDDFTLKKGASRTYSKRTGRTIKDEPVEEPEVEKKEPEIKQESSQGTSKSGTDFSEPIDVDDPEDGLYIEHDDGSSNASGTAEEIFTKDDKEEMFRRPSQREGYKTNAMTNRDGEEITVRFRSQYLNPEVYSKFTENVKPRDPVGSLSNSKVVHKNVLKHDSGTTLIVVCSPKVGDTDIKQSNTQTKYFKDNIKDIVKSKKKPVERLAKGRKTRRTKDAFEMEDDPEWSPEGPVEPSPAPVPQPEEEASPEQESCTTISAGRQTVEQEEPEKPHVDVDDIVRTIKTAPPRKYHRIFRSRNRGYMDPNAERESSPQCEEKPEVPAETTAKVKNEANEIIIEIGSKENGENASEETVEESMDTQESSQGKTSEDGATDSDVMTVESDIDSSQQSQNTDSQLADNESSSQETEEPCPKKIKTVKTPPAERKIFRARGNKGSNVNAQKKIFSSPKKAAAVYNVRSWQDEEEMPVIEPQGSGTSTVMAPPSLPEPPKLKPSVKRAGPTMSSRSRPAPVEMPRLTRAVHWQTRTDEDAYTSVHVNKEHRDLFTVVKNVKEAHECQEHGETQEFDDDIEYLLAGIEAIEPMSTRCLSCVGLAQKCTIPAFRMHLRAHGTVTKIFASLQDAAADPSLALCTSALMFMLSRDRLNMDLEQETLNLMLRLLGVDQQDDMYQTLSPTAERALKRNKDRVLEVYKEFLHQSGTKQDAFDIELLSTGNLAMESLLSLTSRRAGEWFKEELRTLGALDHIVDTVCLCVDLVGDKVTVLTNSNIENLKKVDRCLRVLENVTYMNADNQNYLISYKNTCLIPSLSRALRVCRTCLAQYPLTESKPGKVDKESSGWVIYSCILAVLRVLLNLTHDNDSGCEKIGQYENGLETVLLCILQSPQYVPIDLRFDLYVLALGLLINLVEHSTKNRDQLRTMNTVSLYEDHTDTQTLAYLSLVEVFKRREEAAQQLEEADEPQTPEKSANKSGEWRESDSGMEWVVDSGKKSTGKKGAGPGGSEDKDLDDEETFTKALHNAGKHMENSIVAAYVALLVGCLIEEDQDCKTAVKESLPEHKFDGMIYMLKKFLGFMNLTSGSGSAGGKSIERVIDILEKC